MMRNLAARWGRIGAIALWSLVIVGAIAGAILIRQSEALPEYDDPASAAALQDWGTCADDPQCRASWHERMAAARSAKWPMRNLGVGLCVLVGWLGAMLAFHRLGDLRRLARMTTPGSKLAIVGDIGVVWVGYTFAEGEILIREFGRGYYPPWADSIAIPAYYLRSFVELLPIPLLIGFLVLWGARLSAPLWLWDRDRPWRSGIASLVCAPLVLLVVDALHWRVRDGSLLGVPVGLLALYLVLSARAAVIFRRMPDMPARAAAGDPG